jgi:hypothetical protein
VSGSAGFGAEGALSGCARLAGDSAIEFESGEITSRTDQRAFFLHYEEEDPREKDITHN